MCGTFPRDTRRRARGTASLTVIHDDAGVSQIGWRSGPEVRERLGWDEAGRVFAVKQRFGYPDRDGTFRATVFEEDGGFRTLIDELPRRLEGRLPPGVWLDRLNTAGLEPHLIELYRRPAVDPPSRFGPVCGPIA